MVRGNPRPQFMARLRQVIGERDSVVAFHSAFERQRLEECSEAMPEYTH